MTPGSVADITPNGAAVALSTSHVRAVWIQIHAKTGNGADIRAGDSLIGAARGVAIPAGQTVLFPRCEFSQGGYDLTQVFVYGASGSDACSVTFGA